MTMFGVTDKNREYDYCATCKHEKEPDNIDNCYDCLYNSVETKGSVPCKYVHDYIIRSKKR